MSTKWADEFLDSMRHQIDPTADQVVEQVIASHGLDTFNRTLKQLVDNRGEIPTSLPTSVQAFFEETQKLPQWADQEKIIQGENVFMQYGPETVAMLFFVSLPTAYAMERGSHVLTITAELTKRVHRRIFQTAQFITDVMQPGGLSPNGRGIRSAQKIRLIHASIRYYIANLPTWESEWNHAWGRPINQEDMAETLMDFSVGILRGLKKIRVKLTVDEAEAYHHVWRVVGYILGIDIRLLPENVEDAFELANAISARQFGESNSGKLLARDLIHFLQGYMPRPLKGLPATAIRYLSGDRVADAIKSGPYNWTLIFLYFQVSLFTIFDNFQQKHPASKKMIRFLTWQLMHRVVLHEEGSEFYFDIPEKLNNNWKLSTPASGYKK